MIVVGGPLSVIGVYIPAPKYYLFIYRDEHVFVVSLFEISFKNVSLSIRAIDSQIMKMTIDPNFISQTNFF